MPVETTGALLRTGATAERAAILTCGGVFVRECVSAQGDRARYTELVRKHNPRERPKMRVSRWRVYNPAFSLGPFLALSPVADLAFFSPCATPKSPRRAITGPDWTMRGKRNFDRANLFTRLTGENTENPDQVFVMLSRSRIKRYPLFQDANSCHPQSKSLVFRETLPEKK